MKYILAGTILLSSLILSASAQPAPELTSTDFLPPAPSFGRYSKLRTSFDGVTLSESPTTYFQVASDGALTLPLASARTSDEPLDLTIKFWFKYQAEEISEAYPTSEQMLQFLDLPTSIRCFAQGNLEIMCEMPGAQRLLVSLNQVFSQGEWLHFALTVTKNGTADLFIFNRRGDVVQDSIEEFYIRQQDQQDLNLCFGLCDSTLKGVTAGMPFGIREVAVINAVLTEASIIDWANRIFTYDSRIKGYYRFNADSGRFMKDQFRVVQAVYSKLGNSDANDDETKALKSDYMANDICPKTFELANVVKFDADQKILPANLESSSLNERYFAYTMSVTLYLTDDSCHTTSLSEAQDDCNLVFVDGIFMLYLYRPSVARFFFDAQKKYFQSQSSQFFVPYNQWITIQMQMTFANGYQITVIDQEGTILTNFARETSMERQKPKKDVALFSALQGSATSFVLTDKAYSIPIAVSALENPLFKIDLTEQSTMNVTNYGSRENMQLAFRPNLEVMTYGVVEYGKPAKPYPAFDGITCDDDHVALMLYNNRSSFSFQTPEQSDWMSETTIQFWFKFTNWSQISQNMTRDLSLFQMRAQNGSEYWKVFIQAGQLLVSPFGTRRLADPFIVLSDFNQSKESELGWWHLSCYYQFNAKAECTLYNRFVLQTVEVSLSNKPQYYFEKEKLTATFGSPSDNSLLTVGGLMVKEVRYWSRKVTSKVTTVSRWVQLDIQNVEGLMNYFRLAAGQLSIEDLADAPKPIEALNSTNQTIITSSTNPTGLANQTLNARNSQPKLNQVKFVPDYIIATYQVYDEATLSLITHEKKVYHNVCPVQTYLRDGYCYSDPVNRQHLTIFPEWNDRTKSLDWIFSMDHSSVIKADILSQLQTDWSSTDPALNSILDDKKDSAIKISSSKIRQDNTYLVNGAITNKQGVFSQIDQVNFIPNKCQWFEVGATNDAFSASRTIEQNLSQKDIEFQLSLVQNPDLDCKNFMFYDSFKDISFDFVYQDFEEDSYMIQNPKLKYEIFSPSLGSGANKNDIRTAKDLVIKVTLPIEEQFRLPVWTDIKILMTIDWTSQEFAEYLYDQKTMFQSAMYTIRFEPVDAFLVVDLKQNQKYISKGETLMLFANGTTVDGLHPESVKRFMSYRWLCPEGMAVLCENQSSDTFYLPWNKHINVNFTYAITYTFGVEVTWTKFDGKTEIRQQYVDVLFYNLQVPQFLIQSQPASILVTSEQSTVFTIEGINFDSRQNMSIYDITWTIQPEILNPWARSTANNGQLMEVKAGNWAENTLYTVGVNLIFKEETGIKGYSEIKFQTYAPPKGGSVIIDPPYGYVGQNYSIIVAGYTSKTAVSYNVFYTYDSEGSLRGSQMNIRSVPQSVTYNFTATSENAIVVEVVNTKGESVTVILKPEIVTRPAPLCTTDVVCVNVTKPPTNQTSNSTNTTADGGRLLRLNNTGGITQTQTTNLTEDGTQKCTYYTTCVPQEYNFTTVNKVVGADNNNTVPASGGEEPQNTTLSGSVDKNSTNSTEAPPVDMINKKEFADFGNGTEFSGDDFNSNFGRRLQITSQSEICQQAQQDLESAHRDGSSVDGVLQQLMTVTTAVNCESSLLQVSSFVVNHYTPAQTLTVSLLDAKYAFSTKSIQWYFPDAPNYDFIVQGIAIKDTDLATLAQIRMIDTVTKEVFSLSELDGSVQLIFSVVDMPYVAGQTVCQAKLASGWSSEICLSEVKPTEMAVVCTCSLTEDDDLISLKTDANKEPVDRVDFPNIVLEVQTEVPEKREIVEIKSNYLIVSAIGLGSLSLLGMIVAARRDSRDKARINMTAWQGNLIRDVATQLKEPYQSVMLRQRDIVQYQVNQQLPFIAALNKVHPLLAPMSFSVTQTRLMRFSAYQLQVNLFVISIMTFFGSNYRANDLHRQEFMLDSNDIDAVQTAFIFGAILLMPWLSAPISGCLFTNRVKLNEDGVTFMRAQAPLHLAFIALCAISNVVIVAVAIMVSITAPVANQFLICSAVFASLCTASFISNVVLTFVYLCLPKCLQPADMKQALTDLRAVRTLEQLRSTAKQEQELAEIEPANSDERSEQSKRGIICEEETVRTNNNAI